jgi:hypothetical protein
MTQLRASWPLFLTKYFPGDKIMNNEKGGHVVRTGFLWGNLRKRDHLGDLGVASIIILKCLLKT